MSKTDKLRHDVINIGDRLEGAHAELRHHEAKRDAFAKRAILGDKDANDAVKAIQSKIADSRVVIELAEPALAAAKRDLLVAETAESSAHRIAQANVARDIVDKRIEAGRRFDAAAAEMQAAFEDHEKLGHELQYCEIDLFGSAIGVSPYEAAFGVRRVLAAMPPLIAKLFNTLSLPETRMPLGMTEASAWSSFSRAWPK